MPILRTDDLLERARAAAGIGSLLERLGPAFTPSLALVGGAVRDLLLGGVPIDFDIAVEGPVAALAAVLGAPAIHDRFGTATTYADGIRIDLASTRGESYAAPGALPDVRPASIAEDLARRDFTVNAIALVLTGEDAGDLLEFPGAIGDLEAGCLAVLHPDSFVEDPTRLFRLARYRARLGFTIAPETRSLVAQALSENVLETVSGSRVGNELRLIASEQDPVAAFRALAELGIDRAVHPSFGFGGEESDAAAAERLARAALALLPPDGRSELLAVAFAGRELRRSDLTALLDELAFSAADRDAIVEAATSAARLGRALGGAVAPSEIGAAVAEVGAEAIALAGALGPDDAHRNAERWLRELRHRRLQITGDDLIAAGIPEGPAVGVGLRAARGAMLDAGTQTREQQLAIAVAAARED